MATEKIFLPVLLMFCLCSTAEGITAHTKHRQDSFPAYDTNSNKKAGIVDAVNFASGFFEGEVIKAEKKFKKDIPVWEIELITPERGNVEMEISVSDMSLIKVASGEGPYDYDIKPSDNTVPFSRARKAAEDLTGQKILKWNYFRNRNRWEYNFWLFTRSGRAQVRVDAETGDVITKKKK